MSKSLESLATVFSSMARVSGALGLAATAVFAAAVLLEAGLVLEGLPFSASAGRARTSAMPTASGTAARNLTVAFPPWYMVRERRSIVPCCHRRLPAAESDRVDRAVD